MTLRQNMDGGDMLDTELGHVYIADVNGDGEFFGIMVGDPVPEGLRADVEGAVEFALFHYPAPGTGALERMWLMKAPGWCFGELADAVLSQPERFIA